MSTPITIGPTVAGISLWPNERTSGGPLAAGHQRHHQGRQQQPGAPAAQRLKLDTRGFRTVGLDPGALLKNPVVKVEGQAGKTWLYKL